MASTLFAPGTVVRSIWLNEVDKATHNYLSAVAGTNTITATGPLTELSYVAGDRFYLVPAITNTGATTININGLGAKAVTKYGTVALVAGDLLATEVAEIVYDGVQFQLINPRNTDVGTVTGTLPIVNGGTGATTAPQALINLGAIGRLIGVQTFTASGTYTPTAGTTRIIVKGQGAGGAGGGAAATSAAQVSSGAGGAAGGIGETFLTSGFSGATVTIGTGGVAVSGGSGGTGTITSFGTFLSLTAGAGGITSGAVPVGGTGGSSGGVGTLGNIFNGAGAPGGLSVGTAAGNFVFSGAGGSGQYGSGGRPTNAGGGVSAVGFGTGGSGAANFTSAAAAAGGNGAGGIIIVYEYS